MEGWAEAPPSAVVGWLNGCCPAGAAASAATGGLSADRKWPSGTGTDCFAVFWQSSMRSSCPEPKRSGGATARPARSTTARAVGRSHAATPTRDPERVVCCRSCVGGRQRVQPGSDQTGHFQNLPVSLYLPEGNTPLSALLLLLPLLIPPSGVRAGRALPRPPPQRAGSVHVLPTRHRLRE